MALSSLMKGPWPLTFPNPTFLPCVYKYAVFFHERHPSTTQPPMKHNFAHSDCTLPKLEKTRYILRFFRNWVSSLLQKCRGLFKVRLLIIHIFQVIFSTLNISQLLPTSQLHQWVWQSHPMLPQQPYEAVALLPHSHEDQNPRSFGGALEHLPTGFPGFRRTGMGSFQWMVDDGGMVLSDRDFWWWMILKLNRLMMV